MIRDRLASSEHQRAYLEDIHEHRYGYVRKEMETLSGVRPYMVKMYYLQVEMYTIFDDFIRINESGIKKTITCINFFTVCSARDWE